MKRERIHSVGRSSLRHGKGGAMKSMLVTWVGGVLSLMSLPMLAWAQERPYDWWGMHYMWGAWGIGMIRATQPYLFFTHLRDLDFFLQGCVRRGQLGHGDAIGGATHVINARAMAKLHRPGVASVLATDPDL